MGRLTILYIFITLFLVLLLGCNQISGLKYDDYSRSKDVPDIYNEVYQDGYWDKHVFPIPSNPVVYIPSANHRYIETRDTSSSIRSIEEDVEDLKLMKERNR